MATAARPQLGYLHATIEDLKAKHLYTRLRVLDGEQKPVCISGRQRSDQPRVQQLPRPDD